ncbi:MAG: FMN-binding protein, partial [Oscillospiraceae bacterium]|nr:FMN-binding protein [Oscillospiraceae bacterium]
VAVDAVSSATKAKTRTGSLVGGSYHENSDGSDISGVIFPGVMKNDVELSDFTKVTDDTSVTITVTNRGQTSTTTYSGKDALFESASYSYYELSEAPTCFKVATLEDGTLSFGPVQGVTTALSGVKASLQTESSYGDYQINLMDGSNTLSADSTVYGVILSTREGNDYGLRHLENIWRGTELAFCTGFIEAVHGSPTSPAHYEAIMGQTITQITYLTDTGIYTIATELYVPVKFNGTLSVTDADVSAGTTAVSTNGFPVGYAAKISVANGSGEDVTNTHGFALTGSTLTWMGTPAIGAYTLTVSDTGGVYAPYSAGFELQTAAVPARYDGTTFSLVRADDATADQLAGYLSSITAVKVSGTSYAASGRGAVVIILENGAVDLSAAPFAGMKAGDTYEIEVIATGYSKNLTFTIEISATA